MTAPPVLLSGTVARTFFASKSFSAGVLELETGKQERFSGKVDVTEGQYVNLIGSFETGGKWGKQFVATSQFFAPPSTAEGLAIYLSKDPAFGGIGEVFARRIVEVAPTAAKVDELLGLDTAELHEMLGIPETTIDNLRTAWRRATSQNAVRSFLAGLGLTSRQIEKVIDAYGKDSESVVRENPYRLSKVIDGIGFKTADKMALELKVPREHPGRVEAGIMHALGEQVRSGHTWTDHAELVDLSKELLGLPSQPIEDGIVRLRESQELCGTEHIAETKLAKAEDLIRKTLQRHAHADDGISTCVDLDGLKLGQIDAIKSTLHHRISVISGGAGTGKTFTLARVAKAMQAQGLRIALAAPTGKAAKRIEESMEKQGLRLTARTLHRLMASDGRTFNRPSLSETYSTQFADDPGYDIIIVDEVSMLDVPLASELLSRIDFAKTRLILIGDHNQLPPVGPGNVLRDIIRHKLAPVVVLDEVVRQAGVLKLNSVAVLDGRVKPSDGADWVVVDGITDAEELQKHLLEMVLDRLPEEYGVDRVRDIQVLTPIHDGPMGTKALNELMQLAIHGAKPSRKFAVGDKVIQTKNDYELGVMNGNIGYVLGADPKGYDVDFDGIGEKRVESDQSKYLMLAYAMTAHKAQGSEFPLVVVVCTKSHGFADRNWLYTAVTRAAKHCILVGDGLDGAARRNHVERRRTWLDLWGTQV